VGQKSLACCFNPPPLKRSENAPPPDYEDHFRIFSPVCCSFTPFPKMISTGLWLSWRGPHKQFLFPTSSCCWTAPWRTPFFFFRPCNHPHLSFPCQSSPPFFFHFSFRGLSFPRQLAPELFPPANNHLVGVFFERSSLLCFYCPSLFLVSCGFSKYGQLFPFSNTGFRRFTGCFSFLPYVEAL